LSSRNNFKSNSGFESFIIGFEIIFQIIFDFLVIFDKFIFFIDFSNQIFSGSSSGLESKVDYVNSTYGGIFVTLFIFEVRIELVEGFVELGGGFGAEFSIISFGESQREFDLVCFTIFHFAVRVHGKIHTGSR
jgi:hypothetical protein